MRGWLALRQHDLIEETIKKLLICIVNRSKECEELGDELEPWRLETVRKSLREVSEKVLDVSTAVEYFVGNYGKEFTNTLKDFSNECWKRAALIIGYASAGRPIVPRLEGLPSDVVGSLGDALGKCEEIDYYLLVGGKIPPLIMSLTKDHAYALTEAFVDKYGEAVGEVRRVLNVARGRDISDAEKLYGLGLTLIIANAARLGRDVEPSDADVALDIASPAIQRAASPDLIRPILGALRPLRAEAPQRYLELLAPILDMENLDSGTVKYILNDELNKILDDYGDVVRGYAWSLVNAIIAYAYLLWVYRKYFEDEVKGMVGRVADLLNELSKLSPSLGVIAWAYALDPALDYEDVKRLMEEKLGIDVVDKASEVLGELGRLRGLVQELMNDKEFMDYVESWFAKADEGAVKKVILRASSHLKHALARYRLGNDELDKAEKLFNEAAEEDREIGDYKNYLIDRGWVLRVDAIKGSLVGDELVNGFRQLYEEAFNEEHFEYTARYLSAASLILGNYLVSLALINDVEEIRKLLEERWWVLNANRRVSVLTRLMLNALLGSRVGLSSELKGKLSVNLEELINAFGSDVDIEFLPALMVALGIAKPEGVGRMCMSINDSTKEMGCRYAISVAMNDNAAVAQLREQLIDTFRELLSKRLGLLKELGADADALLNEFRGLVNGLDGKSLAQLIAPTITMARLALMLRALINGDERLAKAHALIGTVRTIDYKLPARLFLETYKACCDLGSEEFRRAIAKRFFYYI